MPSSIVCWPIDPRCRSAQGRIRPKALSPQQKREAVTAMREATAISERRACQLVGMSRTVLHYQSKAQPENEVLQARLLELAGERRRFGYHRLHVLIRREGVQANHKRVYGLYYDAGLSVRRWKRRHGVAVERQALERPTVPSQEVWSMDFVSDALANGRRIKVLTIVDDFSKEAIDLAVDLGISG